MPEARLEVTDALGRRVVPIAKAPFEIGRRETNDLRLAGSEVSRDHAEIVAATHDRLRAKLSYTNVGFALVPREFTISALRRLYSAALGYRVSATNLQRVLTRRELLEPTGAVAAPGPAGGRPAALFRFADHSLRVTDAFAVLRPPGGDSRGALAFPF